MPRRIIFLGNSVYNIAHFRAPLIDSFLAEGDEVHVAGPDDAWSAALAARGIAVHPVPIDRGGMSPWADSRLFLDYRRLFAKVRPDAVLAFTAKPNIYGSLAARSRSIPVINNISGLGTAFLSHGWLERLVSALYRVALRRSHTVFFQNDEDRDLFVERRLVEQAQARLVPGSGVDLDRFAPRPFAPGPVPTFVCVARMLRDKGIREIAEASEQLRSEGFAARFRLVGPIDPDNRSALAADEIESWVAAGLVEYAGPMDDVRDAIAGADAVLLPSYREGLPRTLIEASAMGRPVIATDVPGCRTIVEDGATGLLCAPRSGAALADAVRRFLAMSGEERAAMGRAGRAKVEREYDQRLVVAAYRAALDSAVGTKSV
ncbi:glycosyltransferase family 4 protein [Sphingomonas sp. ASV193]|uniref:glycosyltransferase family 4 protein n=1 Tax=Sphingomonas sp. ASV193 TaxID=3144405 RepID=UPI0032E8F497